MRNKTFGIVGLVLTVFALLIGLFAVASLTSAQNTTNIRLGGINVEAYCNDLGLRSRTENNGAEWACYNIDSNETIITLGQDRLNEACRQQYGGNSGIVAIQSGSDAVPAFNWACFQGNFEIGPTKASNAVSLGGLNVEAYCNARGYGVTLINSNTQFACTSGGGTVALTLSPGDLTQVCRETYGLNRLTVVAIWGGSDPIVAFNWGCFNNLNEAGALAASPVSIAAPQRVGGLDISGYCALRGLRAQLVNDNNDWACIDSFAGTIDFVLSTSDYNAICQNVYAPRAFAVRDGGTGIAAWNWSCHTPAGNQLGSVANNVGPRDINIGRVIGFVAARDGYEVNVRAEPAIEAEEIGEISWAGSYPLLRVLDGWYAINYNGTVGYVSRNWTRIRSE